MKSSYEKNIEAILSAPILIPEIIENRIAVTCNRLLEEKDKKKLQKFTPKRIAVCIAAAALLVSGTVFAYSSITRESHSLSREENFEKSSKTTKDAYIPKELNNGYKFIDMSTQEGSVSAEKNSGFESKTIMYTENGNIEEVRKNGGNTAIYMTISKNENAVDQISADETVTKDGTKFQISYTTTKCVPPDYQLTEEDIELQKRKDYFISYGTQQIEIHNNIEIRWKSGDYFYSLLTWNEQITKDELLNNAIAVNK